MQIQIIGFWLIERKDHMDGKFLGKITSAEFGVDRDYRYDFGLYLTFSIDASTVSCMYAANINPECKYNTPSGRQDAVLAMAEQVAAIFKAAKVTKVSELVGKPVEVTIENRTFKNFRILTEVL